MEIWGNKKIAKNIRRDRFVYFVQVDAAHSSDVNCLVVSHVLSLIASGSSGGFCRLWDLQFLSSEGNCTIGDEVGIRYCPRMFGPRRGSTGRRRIIPPQDLGEIHHTTWMDVQTGHFHNKKNPLHA